MSHAVVVITVLAGDCGILNIVQRQTQVSSVGFEVAGCCGEGIDRREWRRVCIVVVDDSQSGSVADQGADRI